MNWAQVFSQKLGLTELLQTYCISSACSPPHWNTFTSTLTCDICRYSYASIRSNYRVTWLMALFNVLQHIPCIRLVLGWSLTEQLPSIWCSVAPGYFSTHTMCVQTALCLCEFLQYSPYPHSIYAVCADSELIILLLFSKIKHRYSEETKIVHAWWNVQD